ncbi:hypothetical protein D3C71_1905400 [compost metagenome]
MNLCCFCSGVCRSIFTSKYGVLGAYEYHAAANTLLFHNFKRFSCDKEIPCAKHVHVQVPLFKGCFVKRTGSRKTCVVHDNVDTAEAKDRLAERCFYFFFFRYVHANSNGSVFAVLLVQFSCQLLSTF